MDSVDSRQNHFARIQIDSPKGTQTSDPGPVVKKSKPKNFKKITKQSRQTCEFYDVQMVNDQNPDTPYVT